MQQPHPSLFQKVIQMTVLSGLLVAFVALFSPVLSHGKHYLSERAQSHQTPSQSNHSLPLKAAE